MKRYKQLRKDFPILSRKIGEHTLIYCDNAATTQKPLSVINAISEFYTKNNATVHKSIHSLGENATSLYEQARSVVAHFIGAQPSEIVFTSGTTEGINFVANTWAEQHINPGDEIVLTELEHHANLIPWQQLAHRKKAALKFIPVNSDGTLDMQSVKKIITDKTKLVAITHVSNAIGTHVDIEKIIAAAKAVNAYTLIDAAQSVGHQKINIASLGVDFLVFSGHKMLGPTGIGVLFIAKKLHALMQPYRFGGGIVDTVTFFHSTWTNAPHKFEAGTPPIAQAIGLAAAISYLNSTIDFEDMRIHQAQLCNRLITGLCTLPSVKILGPIEELKKTGHLVSFIIQGIHSHDVAAFLDSQGISVRAGHHCAQPLAHKLGYDASVRVSFYFYNTQQEVDYIINAITQLIHSEKLYLAQ